jgi:hypothetical protein
MRKPTIRFIESSGVSLPSPEGVAGGLAVSARGRVVGWAGFVFVRYALC